MISRLRLHDLRTYAALDLAVDARLVALAGENGAGKTNLLEAISLLSPGRGLRRADPADLARRGGSGGWAVAADVSTGHPASAAGDAPMRLGTGVEPGEGTRRHRVDGAPATAGAFADHLRLVWLTPDLDGLFRGPAGDRRRFLDRLVLAVDAAHAGRATAYERALRSRNRLLEEERPDAAWLDALEREAAELGVALAAARRETVDRLAGAIEASRGDDASPFPFAVIALDGLVEDALKEGEPALAVEETFRERLRANRVRDRAAGRAVDGPQASDLAVRHGPKDVEAGLASTGEQKALLIGLVLAHAALVREMTGLSPTLLLDEVAAHLDPTRRAALYERLDALDAQVWMTGADRALFAALPGLGRGTATLLEVSEGAVREARSDG